jgi:hypothetical protein
MRKPALTAAEAAAARRAAAEAQERKRAAAEEHRAQMLQVSMPSLTSFSRTSTSNVVLFSTCS